MSNSDASSYTLRYNEISTHLEYAEGGNWFPVPTSSAGVSSLNTLTGAVTLAAGSGITITPSSNTLMIASTSSGGITQLTGDVTAGPGSGSQAATLATVNSNVGSFTNASVTVNAKGLVTAASSGTAPVTSVSGTAGEIASSGGATPTLALITTAVTPGTYYETNLTVDSFGRITAASNGGSNVVTTTGTGTVSPGSAVGVNQFETTVTGDVTMDGPTGGVDGQKVTFRILNDGSHTVTFATGAGNFGFGTTIPSYTNSVSLTDYIGAIYSTAAGLWHIVAVSQGF
jgi:hypothetical protein